MASMGKIARPLLSQQICRQCIGRRAQSTFVQAMRRPERLQYEVKHQRASTAIRWHSITFPRSKQYDFAGIKQMTEQPRSESILIDVREPNEYEAGYIPTAINIPVKTSPDAMALPEEEFEDRFGFEKPSTDKEVVFYCRSGVRSSAAAQLAQQNGYKNVSEYKGSWLDWEKQGGQGAQP